MKGKIFVALAIVAVAGIASGPVNAGCAPDQAFATCCGGSGNFDVVFQGAHGDYSADDTTIVGAVIGHVWGAGAFATTGDLSGLGCPDNTWLQGAQNGGTYSIFGDNGADFGSGLCDTAVCPPNELIVLVQTKSTDGKNASFTVGRTSLLTTFPSWEYGLSGSNWNMVDIPRPKVTLMTPGSSTPSVNIAVDAPDAAFHSAPAGSYQATASITSYQLVRFTGPADPGREAALWTNLGSPLATTAPSANGVVLDCSGGVGTHVFLANRPIFDGGQLAGDYVSASVDINCADLAHPGSPKIKPIGPKKIVPGQPIGR